MTIHHLLTHTSGLGDFFGDPGFFETAATWTSTRQAMDGVGEFVRRETLAFEPGAASGYSNAAYHVLQEIVEKASSQDYLDYYEIESIRGIPSLTRNLILESLPR